MYVLVTDEEVEVVVANKEVEVAVGLARAGA